MTIDVELSTESIDRAIRLLEDYQKRLDSKIEELLDAMVKAGEEYALYQLSMHIDTGLTMHETYGYRNGKVGYIVSGGAAIWLEFGTGVVANKTYQGAYVHPVAGAAGMMGIGDYGQQHGADPNGWWYYDGNGKKRHTFGIPATMFMYNTAQQLRRDYPDLARRLFDD